MSTELTPQAGLAEVYEVTHDGRNGDRLSASRTETDEENREEDSSRRNVGEVDSLVSMCMSAVSATS